MTQATFELLLLLLGSLAIGYVAGWYIARNRFERELIDLYRNFGATSARVHDPVIHEQVHTISAHKSDSLLERAARKVSEAQERAASSSTTASLHAHDNHVPSPVRKDESTARPEPVRVEPLESDLPNNLPMETIQAAPSVGNTNSKAHDLKIVEGIGPKIQELLNNNGIVTLKDLAESNETRLREILVGAGERYRIHDPSTWPEQARLADEGKLEELSEYQDFLSGGKMLK